VSQRARSTSAAAPADQHSIRPARGAGVEESDLEQQDAGDAHFNCNYRLEVRVGVDQHSQRPDLRLCRSTAVGLGIIALGLETAPATTTLVRTASAAGLPARLFYYWGDPHLGVGDAQRTLRSFHRGRYAQYLTTVTLEVSWRPGWRALRNRR
jgi:hypothetical protein